MTATTGGKNSDMSNNHQQNTEHQSEIVTDLKELQAPGQRLRQARESQGLTIEDVASELRLDVKLIRALEAGDSDNLPEQPVFTAGYLRSYARFVGLPADDLVTQYVSTETQDIPPIDRGLGKLPGYYRRVADALPKSFSTSTSHRREISGKQQAYLLAGMVLVIFISWQSTRWFSNDDENVVVSTGESATDTVNEAMSEVETKTASKPVDLTPIEQTTTATKKPEIKTTITKNVDATEQTQSASDTDTEAQVETIERTLQLKPLVGSVDIEADSTQAVDADSGSMQLSLHFSENSWVDIRDSTGKRLIRELGFKGVNKQISGVAPFQVLLGYGPGVEIANNGKIYDFSRYQKQKIARFMLDIDKVSGINEPLDAVVTEALDGQESGVVNNAPGNDEAQHIETYGDGEFVE